MLNIYYGARISILHVDNCRVAISEESSFQRSLHEVKKAEVKNKQRFNCVLRNQQLEAFLHEKDKQTITFS